MAIVSDKQLVSIDASGNATARFLNLNGLVGYVFVTPVGSPSAVNAQVAQKIDDFEHVHKASAPMSISNLTVAYSLTVDSVVIMVTEATPLVINFSGGTSGNQYRVTAIVDEGKR